MNVFFSRRRNIRRPFPWPQKKASVALLARSSVAVFILLSLPYAFASGAPKAVFAQTHFSFEKTVCGAVVEHDFILKNEGSTPLRIGKVSMTSPLLVTRMPREIAPGAAATIRLKLDTASLTGAFHGEIL